MVESSKIWLDDIIQTLKNLGGEADLKDIYKELKRIRKVLNPTWHSTVRRCLQQYSSDSKAWGGKWAADEDLFYHVKAGVWGLRRNKNFWFVSQSQTFEHERSGGYLWAPYENKRGQEVFHYKTMSMVKRGDIIFSNYKKTIPCISEVLSKAEEKVKIPDEFEVRKKKHPWKKIGRKVRVKYLDIKPLPFTSEIRKKLDTYKGKDEWILDKNLNTSQRYLLPLPKKAAKYLLKICDINIQDIDNFNEEIQTSDNEKKYRKIKKGGQGFGLSKKERDAVELHAIEKVKKKWEKTGWKTKDTSKDKTNYHCDFEFKKGTKKVFCEVKGSTTSGEKIILTKQEVDFMKDNYPDVALCIVYGIFLDKSKDPPKAQFGKIKTLYPWKIQKKKLITKDYYYTVK